MKKFFILSQISFFILVLIHDSTAQKNYQEDLINKQVEAALQSNYLSVKSFFEEAYAQYPAVPKGILEAVSYHYTHFSHITASTPESSEGIPRVYGVMGLTLDGENYFRNNLLTVSALSGYLADQIIEDPSINVLAYAAAFSALKAQLDIQSDRPEDMTPILMALNELNISSETAGNDYAMNLFLYGVLKFLNTSEYQEKYGFPAYSINLSDVFGENNLKIFSAGKISISESGVTTGEGLIYAPTDITVVCPDYNFSNCSWVASPNHYTGWNGHTISSVTMHTVQGSYTGCISWFQNTSADAATHYVVASNSSYAGQVTQMVNETNAGWHVGSENWYTIGYEHEGYVDNPSWYTATMYQTSAAITRDICADHSISTLRMFYRDTLDDGTVLDYGIHSLGGEGTCVKIKGHQHYPNQTHTDPGPNWYWDYYFKLVNPNYTPTTYTASSGSFYDSGGISANHGDDERLVWLIQPTGGATSITLTFSSFALEDNYDFLYIYDGDDVFSPLIGRYNTTSPGTVTAYSGTMCIEFRSDCLTNEAGWAATWTSVQPDAVAPTTSVSVPGNWQTQDFTATFTDSDNSGGSGLEKSFYQVLDFDGTEWHANADNGFFADNFDTYDAAIWSVPASSGTWTVIGGSLIQTDTSVNNTNVYASLDQNLSNRYIYQFYEKIDAATSGTNQHRFGFHFFSDDGSLTNRGNSYFIFFRQETSQLEFYKVISNTFTQVKVVTGVTTTFGQWYDFKIIFDRISGKIDVYRDNILLGTWTDTTPLTNSGDYISFRTGHCKTYISELKVYRSRYPTTSVTVGAAATNDIRYQNPDPSTYGAKIKSIVNDAAGNLSSISYYDLNVDWTPPSCVVINDGQSSPDSDTTSSLTTLAANWTASADTHSGIAKYWYAIGTTAGGTDIVNWTDNSLNTTVTKSGLSLTVGQTYYFSVKAENGAGLICTVNSNGITIINPVNINAVFTTDNSSICVGESVQFTNSSTNSTSYLWTFDGGNPTSSTDVNPLVTYNSEGVYDAQLIALGTGPSDTIVQTITVTAVPTAPVSATADHLTFCEGVYTNITLSATGGSGSTLTWSTSCGGASIGTGNDLVIPAPSSSTTYYAYWNTSCGISSCASVSVTVNPLPEAPFSATADHSTFCEGEYPTLIVAASGGDGLTLNWYETCGGSIIGTGNNTSIPAPVVSTTYYAAWTNGCGTSSCASFDVTVNPVAVAPTLAEVDQNNFCPSTVPTITLTATGGSGNALNWYAGSCDGVLVGTGSPLTIASPVSSTTYFAAWETDCGLSSCASIAVNTTSTAMPPVSVDVDSSNYCESSVWEITLTATGGSGTILNWYSDLCGGTTVGTGSPLTIAAPTSTTTYYSAWSDACGASSCQSVTITVNPLPVPPISASADHTSFCSGEFDHITLSATGGNGTTLNWYSSGGVYIGTGNDLVIAAPATDTTYYASWTNACGTSPSSSIDISVNASPIADFFTPDTILNTGDLALFTNNSTVASGYFWDFGDGNTSTDTNPWNIYADMGDYTVTLVAYNADCEDTLIMENYIHVGTTEIAESADGMQLLVLPNPFSENLNISFALGSGNHIKIVIADMLGKEIEITDDYFSAGYHSIAASDKVMQLSKGIYSLQIASETISSTLILIKY